MGDIEDREEQVQISWEDRGDRERITIDRTKHVRRVVEQPKAGRIGRGRGGLEGEARRMIGSQQDSRLEEEEEEVEQEAARGKGKGKAPAKRTTHIPVSSPKKSSFASLAAAAQTKQKTTAPPSTPKKMRKAAAGGKTVRGRHGKAARGAKRKRVGAGGDETTESFGVYIHRVLKQVHPNMTVSKRCVDVLNSMVADVFGRVAAESKALTTKAAMKTLDSRTIQTAVRLILPGELAKHAVSEGTQAVVRFSGGSK